MFADLLVQDLMLLFVDTDLKWIGLDLAGALAAAYVVRQPLLVVILFLPHFG